MFLTRAKPTAGPGVPQSPALPEVQAWDTQLVGQQLGVGVVLQCFCLGAVHPHHSRFLSHSKSPSHAWLQGSVCLEGGDGQSLGVTHPFCLMLAAVILQHC